MSTNQVDVSKSFQEKVFNRIRDSIGQLMTDEELKALLDTTIQKAFFEERKERDPNRSSHYSDHFITKEPWMVEMIRGLMKERMQAALKLWLDEHSEEVLKILQACIDKGFMKCVTDAIDYKMTNSMLSMREEFKNQLGVSR